MSRENVTDVIGHVGEVLRQRFGGDWRLIVRPSVASAISDVTIAWLPANAFDPEHTTVTVGVRLGESRHEMEQRIVRELVAAAERLVPPDEMADVLQREAMEMLIAAQNPRHSLAANPDAEVVTRIHTPRVSLNSSKPSRR